MNLRYGDDFDRFELNWREKVQDRGVWPMKNKRLWMKKWQQLLRMKMRIYWICMLTYSWVYLLKKSLRSKHCVLSSMYAVSNYIFCDRCRNKVCLDLMARCCEVNGDITIQTIYVAYNLSGNINHTANTVMESQKTCRMKGNEQGIQPHRICSSQILVICRNSRAAGSALTVAYCLVGFLLIFITLMT